MSKENSTIRFLARNVTENTPMEGNENHLENELVPAIFPPPRTPLNTIPDPTQHQREFQEIDFESKHKTEGGRAHRLLDKKTEVTDGQLTLNKAIGNICSLNYGTPRVPGRGRAYSEPNSAQSTPARSVSRVSNIGASTGAYGGLRPQHSGTRVGSSSRVSRGISLVNLEQSIEGPHFELVEDPSFWKDHNVQVLIRIRPLSNTEMISQGYGRCLRQESAQTLVWLGHPETRFTFDHVACETISQEKLFRVAGLPMVDNCMTGYNSCMFAYGQTGSGKTHTMMGEICQMDGVLNADCGITPRIFEYLFRRIREDEENRRDEQLEYSCKCSFLEIYNEQITDLLEPSSTNLQLREDLKKGVYVENLTEHSVRNVNDVLKLLIQGSANRKMAATHMNSESSRSHSVFTCIIESHWEKDSMSHLRFGRLNLVDLAGSERQKSSGAEGDRLKEAANINKSLSTLGLVIMSLVDLAHGKHRHVPYRDSRLTFLLQDSLGGNSKTTIIANVSPSTCSANETLSTLKFAQRAKLIQNNAKVNEDASGNVTALQRHIQQLQGQLSFLMEHYKISRSVSTSMLSFQQSSLGDSSEDNDWCGESKICDDAQNVPKRNVKCLEAGLVGALRREKLAETALRTLEAEIEQMNRLANQREEDAQRVNMLLRLREEKIKRLELLADGLISADKYLMEECTMLKEENQLLQERIDRNPEVTRLALENIRLLDQLRLFQEFYEQGERDKLRAEISELRDQLLPSVEGNCDKHNFSLRTESQGNDADKELAASKNMNSKLMREVDESRAELRKYSNQAVWDSVADFSVNDSDELKQSDKCLMVETMSTRCDMGEEVTSHYQLEEEVWQNTNGKKIGDALAMHSTYHNEQLVHARSSTKTIETEHLCPIEEMQFMHEEDRFMGIVNNTDLVGRESVLHDQSHCYGTVDLENQKQVLVTTCSKDIRTITLQAKLDKVTKELEEARVLNCQYREDQALDESRKHQTEFVCKQVEMETANTILHLQEEVAALQSELEEKLCYMTKENLKLEVRVAAKEEEIKVLGMEWERATLELTSFLIDGSKSLRNASRQVKSISCSFPGNLWLGDHVEKAAKVCIEKEETILLLQKSLEDAQKMVFELEEKLNSLKGATIALTEVGYYNITELTPDEDTDQASNFFIKLEEARSTMKEADVMLNALLQENENAKQLSGMWKQAGQELIVEKSNLINDIKQLNSLIHLKDGENEMLQHQIHYSLQEMANSVSLLEGTFLQMQRDMEKMVKAIYYDASTMAQNMLQCFRKSRSSLEEICFEAMEQGFALLVLYQCHVDKFFRKFPNLCVDRGFCQHRFKEIFSVRNSQGSEIDNTVNHVKGRGTGYLTTNFTGMDRAESASVHGNLMDENLMLKKELQRKEVVLKGLFFDFSLLQESTSTKKDMKDETEKLIVALSQVQKDLQMKTNQLNDVLVQQEELEGRLADIETALFISNSDLELARETVGDLSYQNSELRLLVKDLYLRKSKVEEQLEEQREIVRTLEEEILRMNSSAEKRLESSIEDIEDVLGRVTVERDQFQEQVVSLQDRLEMACSLADENEAIAVEARQESEASKLYAEQKEEEVKILEHSVQELDRTINVLEKKVFEMEEEVEKHKFIRDSLELELQALKQRMITVENFTEIMGSENSSFEQSEDYLSRQLNDRSLELHEAHKKIRLLEEEKAELVREMKQCKEHISELVLHSEAQASQYQEKYKALEAMICEMKSDSSALTSAPSMSDKTEKSLIRPRGSSSPFRCISSLVQQMNLEKDQELSTARLRIQELEALANSRQKEICTLNTRLAAAENMTHDVIRDLLGVKLDITNYANLIDQYQIQRLVEDAQLQAQEFAAMEQETLELKRQLDDLTDEKKRCISELRRTQSDIVAAQVNVEQLKDRVQLLTAQNEMLKVDNSNLKMQIVELDDMVKKLFGTQNEPPRRQLLRTKNLLSQQGNAELCMRLAKSEKPLPRANGVITQYCKPDGRDEQDKLATFCMERRIRKQMT